jgi:sugar/nucleoside kinase (ribokinase family)
MKILCIGDLMLDVTVKVPSKLIEGREIRSEIFIQGGGAAANVATWLTHQNINAYMVTRTGADLAGEMLLADLAKHKVEYSPAKVSDKATGTVVVLVDGDGERTMYPDSGANAGLSPNDLPNLTEITAAYLSGYSLLNQVSRPGVLAIIKELKSKSIPIFFDPSTVGIMAEAPLAELEKWISEMSALVLNEEEAQYLTGKSNPLEAIELLLNLVEMVIIKRGSRGAIGKKRGMDLINIPATQIVAVDSTGAGDAFMAGVIGNYYPAENLEKAILAGVALGGKCAAKVGSRPLV